MQGRGASALLSAENRGGDASALLAGRPGQRADGAEVLSADELEGCEIGEIQGSSGRLMGSASSLI